MPSLPCAWPRALVCRFHNWWLRLRRPSPDPLGVAQACLVCAICFERMCELAHTREGIEIDRLTHASAKKVENRACAVALMPCLLQFCWHPSDAQGHARRPLARRIRSTRGHTELPLDCEHSMNYVH